MKVKIEEIKKLKGNKERGMEMVWVRLEKGSEEQRRQVLERKRNLRGRKEIIVEDLIWKETKILEAGGHCEDGGGERREEKGYE